MKNPLPFDKVFLTSGCSYTPRLIYIQSILDKYPSDITNTKTLFNHIGLPSASIKHLKNSTITFVDYLLKNGIKNENIYVVGNLTQIGRKNFKFNKNEQNDVINLISKTNYVYSQESSIMDLNFIKYPYGFCKMNNNLYSSLINDISFYNTLPLHTRKRIETFLDYHNHLSMEELVEDYFSDLIILQEYLKKNKIEYTLFFMNNILEGWNSTYTTHIYNNFYGKYKVPDLRNTHNIKNINNQVESLFNLIDFDNIACYSSETQIYGGIDEYAIDNFKPTDFAGRENLELKEYYGPEYCFFGQHPLENVQYEFEKNFIYPKMKKFIKTHYAYKKIL